MDYQEIFTLTKFTLVNRHHVAHFRGDADTFSHDVSSFAYEKVAYHTDEEAW